MKMQLNLNRLDETLFLFGRIMPLGSIERQAQLQKSLGMNMTIDNAISILMRSLHTMMKENPESALGYLDFIKQSIDYVFEISDSMPEIDVSDETLKTELKIYYMSKKDYEK